MRTLVYQFPATIPAGTPKATPVVVSTVFEPNQVERIEWLFPRGCNGLVGIQIGARSVPLLPLGGTNWFISSGTIQGIDVAEMHDSGDWSVIGYNTGVNPHTIQVTFWAHRKEPVREPFRLIADIDLTHFPLRESASHG